MSLELNSCFLIDYRLWAAKSEGRQWVEQCIEQCLEHPPEPRSGLCPELLADFRIPNLLGARRGHRGQFSVQSDNRFSGGGGGVGSLPRAWRRVGVPGGHRPGEGLVCVSVSAEGKFGFRCMHCTSDHEWADPNDHTKDFHWGHFRSKVQGSRFPIIFGGFREFKPATNGDALVDRPTDEFEADTSINPREPW